MMTPQNNIMSEKKYPYFVELVGLAGAGKSTLAAALVDQMEKVVLILPPDLHAARDIPFFVLNSIRMLPTFFGMIRESGWKLPSAHEMALMVMLNGWPRRLLARPNQECNALLVDQGPISFFAMLERMDAPWRRTSTGKKWLKKTFERWSGMISLVIMLDAENSVLLNRIRTRSQVHRLQTATDEEAVQTLELYRRIYPNVIGCLRSTNAELKTFSYVTTFEDKEALHLQIADDLEHSLGLACKGGD